MSLASHALFASAGRISRSAAARFIFAVAVFALCAGGGHAQTTQTTTDKLTPSGMAPGAPAGSYALSGFESINLYNGNLDFRLPLVTLGGRGAAQRAIMLSINTKKWRVRESHTETSSTYTPTTVNWGSVNVGYSAGRLQGRQSGYDARSCSNPNQKRYWYTLTRLTFVTPDGTEYDLRDELTDGRPMAVTNWCSSTTVGAARGTVFKTRDGSGVTFISDAGISDKTSLPVGSSGSWNLNVSGYLVMRDGTRYRIDGGGVSWIRDRNGNLIYSQQDAIGRTVSITTSADGTEDYLTYKGFGGAARTLRVTRTLLGSALRPNYSLQSHSQLFPQLNGSLSYGSGAYNPMVVSAVYLPDGRSYRFKYNSYGELAWVELPTGGAVEYYMNSGSGVVSGFGLYGDEKQIYRRVVERRTYADGVTLEGRTTYTSSGQLRTVDHLTPGGALLAREKHYFNGDAVQSLFAPAAGTFHSDWREGRETATEYLAADGVTVLRRVSNTWEQRAPVSWYPSQYANGGNEPASDPRITQTVTTLVDTNQVSKQTFLYDQYNNQTDLYEYDYGAGAAGPLLRRTHTDFLSVNPVNGVDYASNASHIRNLPAQTSVYDANGAEQARTTYEYDNYAADAYHAGLTDRPGIFGLDAAFNTAYTARGNATRVTRWLLPANAPVSAYQQYDIAGNVVKVIDPRSNATIFEYSDRFGSPDGNAHSNTAPAELGGLSSYAFVTGSVNALGQTLYGQYDYYLGRAVDGEDLNGVVATGFYNDALDRPTQVISAYGTAEQRQTSFAYNDAARTITTTGDLNGYADNLLKSEMLYDGLGRTVETRTYEAGGVYVASKQTFDAMGRASQNSNPYRPGLGESPLWTTTAYDGVGRVVSVTTPDGAIASTAYSGNQTTATDQSLKSRRSVADALGRLTTVFEDPNGLNYQTSYAYDVLDNLRTVTQGSQTRTFAYDSLSRLISATNPENGTVSYQYDGGSNLTQRTDARGVTATNAYDALNRVTSRSYNDGTASVAYFYDSQPLPGGAPAYDRGYAAGRLVAVTHGGSSAGTYSGFSQAGKIVRQVQQTDSVNYLVEATYNKAGTLKTETYPAVPGSGDRRVVNYDYDLAGRPSSMTTAATGYAAGASATINGYAAHGSITGETYGNGLAHTFGYNSRLQTTEIKLGTAGSPASVLGLTYDYGTTNNNGNVNGVTYGGGGINYAQTFGYDTLNRLATSQETAGGSVSWSQTNGYDRHGNRWVVLAGGAQSQSFDGNNRITGASYDPAGNLLSDGAHGYGYDAESRVSSVDGTAAYRYDGGGQRVRKFLGENLRLVYDMAGQLIAEFDGATGALRKEYVYGASGVVATVEPAAGTKYTTSDLLGSPRVVTNAGGGVVSRHDYMPFGEELAAGTGGRTAAMGYGAADGFRQKFTGKERDSETGLDYFTARYYASGQGRFTTTDPLLASASVSAPQTWNRYAYVLNNPARPIDPDGLDDRDANQQGEQRRQQVSGQPPPPPQTLTATVSETPEVTFYYNASLGVDKDGKPIYFTGYGAVQKITLLQDGKPVLGLTGTEDVVGLKGEAITQNDKPVAAQENGEMLDFVSRGQATNARVDYAAGVEVFKENGEKPVDVTTRQTLTVNLPDGGRAQIIFDRRLRNVDDNGKLRPSGPVKSGVPTNYSLNVVSSVTVKRLP